MLPLCTELSDGSHQSVDGLCTVCPDGEHKYGLGKECTSCPSDGVLYAQSFVGFVWVAASIVAIWNQASEKEGRAKIGRAAGEIVAIVLQHTQLMAMLLVVPWKYPDWLLDVMKLPAAFLGGDMLMIFSVDCLGHTDGAFFARWFASSGFFMLTIVGALVTSILASVMAKPVLADHSYHKAVLLFGLMFTSIVRGNAAIHDCVQHGDIYVVDHTPEIACDYSHGTYAICAVLSGVMLQVSLLLPMISLNVLHHKHGKMTKGGLGTPKDISRFGWMFTRYRYNKYWWETFVMYKTAVTCFGCVWFSHDTKMCSLIVLPTLIVNLFLQIQQQPMECTESEKGSKALSQRRGNRLALLTVSSQVAFVLVSVISEDTGGPDRSGALSALIGVLIILLYIAPLVGAGILFLLEHNDGHTTGEAPRGRADGNSMTVLDISTKSYDGDMSPLSNFTVAFSNPLGGGQASIDGESDGESQMKSSFESEGEEDNSMQLKSPGVNGMRQSFDAEEIVPKLKSVKGNKSAAKAKDMSLE